MKPIRRAARWHQTDALLLRRVAVGDADLVLHLLTETAGRVSALARAARKSQKRFGGALEPFHTLRVRLEERDGQDLMALQEAALASARHRLVSSLQRMEGAGRVLGWVRRAAPLHVKEPAIWEAAVAALDALDAEGTPDVTGEVARTGLRLLAACGWGLELDQCVECARACNPGKAAYIDPQRGGIVCRSCGGARTRLTGVQRARFAAAAVGTGAAWEPEDAPLAMDLVDAAMRAHLGIES